MLLLALLQLRRVNSLNAQICNVSCEIKLTIGDYYRPVYYFSSWPWCRTRTIVEFNFRWFVAYVN